MKRILILTALFLLLFAAASVGIASAQEPVDPSTGGTALRVVSDDEVNLIAKQLYCPICENTPLDVCPTQACKDWREMIRQQLGQGWTEQQIKDYFVAKYGPRVLAKAPARGFTSLVWILPFIGLLGGGFFLWRVLRRWQQNRPRSMLAEADPTSTETVAPDVLEKIEDEISMRF